MPGTQVRVRRIGRGVLLEPIDVPFDVKASLAKIDEYLDEPFMPEGRQQPPLPVSACALQGMICLDTNAVIAVLNDRDSPVRARIDAAIGRGRTLAISSIVLFELRYGAAKSTRPDRNARRIADFLSGPIEVLPFEPADADEAGDIRAALERAGTPIRP